MGNRAVITNKDEEFGVYLHWNGGRDSVEAFLKYCEIAGFRDLTSDPSYGFARLTQVITNWFGGGLSCGVNVLKKLDCDNFDNGLYIVDGWKIVGRKYHDGPEQQEYDLLGMLLDIDSKQSQHIGEEEIKKYLKEHPVAKEEKKEEEDIVVKTVNALGHSAKQVENGYEITITSLPSGGEYVFTVNDKHNIVYELEHLDYSLDEDQYVKDNLGQAGAPGARGLLQDFDEIVRALDEIASDLKTAIYKENTK